MMPGFFKCMPRPQPGRWRAEVFRTYCFSGDKVTWSRSFNGLLRSYLAVRIAALIEDLRTPYWDGEVGIEWRIRKDT